mmetsp:Transcript_10939/g.30304  ORF Transcript_10939/g.30304 Transcript_10939/m.30304 type:complete len:163 (+) Transcript_10939:946-1434(+)
MIAALHQVPRRGLVSRLKVCVEHARGAIKFPGISVFDRHIIARTTFAAEVRIHKQIQSGVPLAARIVPQCRDETRAALGHVEPLYVCEMMIPRRWDSLLARSNTPGTKSLDLPVEVRSQGGITRRKIQAETRKDMKTNKDEKPTKHCRADNKKKTHLRQRGT